MRKDIEFFKDLFGTTLDKQYGEIEIRSIDKQDKDNNTQKFFSNIEKAMSYAEGISHEGVDTYFGVNPRVGKKGTKDNVLYLVAFHADIDVKLSEYNTKEEALKVIDEYHLPPSYIIDSGNGFHLYWILKNPEKVSDHGKEKLDSINAGLCNDLKGDKGTFDISRILRVPGTFNYKDPANPKPVELVINTGRKYQIEDFECLIQKDEEMNDVATISLPVQPNQSVSQNVDVHVDINNLPVTERIKDLIKYGDDGSHKSDSEADMTVIVALVSQKVPFEMIKSIFKKNLIGNKYREHLRPHKYLEFSYHNAVDICKKNEGPSYILKKDKKEILEGYKFFRHMENKYNLVYDEVEDSIYAYYGTNYSVCLNHNIKRLCLLELDKEYKEYKKLFTKKEMEDFIHLCGSAKAKFKNDNNMLSFRNGVFNVDTGGFIDHSPKIFTTYAKQYDYKPDSDCPKFKEYLSDIFKRDDERDFLQEVIGYGLHDSVPTPAIFCLFGGGCNGKSVMIDTIEALHGEEATARISIQKLTDEKYLTTLKGKVVNLAEESPSKKRNDTELMKLISSGGKTQCRELYKSVETFKSNAKLYFAMNELPFFQDTTHGFERRIIMIPFSRQFDDNEIDPYLRDKLKEELSGIFNWAYQGYLRLRSKKFLFNMPDSFKLMQKHILHEDNPVKDFLDQNLVKTSNDKDCIKYGSLYDMYKNNTSKPVKKSDFKNILKSLEYKIETGSGNVIFVKGAKMI